MASKIVSASSNATLGDEWDDWGTEDETVISKNSVSKYPPQQIYSEQMSITKSTSYASNSLSNAASDNKHKTPKSSLFASCLPIPDHMTNSLNSSTTTIGSVANTLYTVGSNAVTYTTSTAATAASFASRVSQSLPTVNVTGTGLTANKIASYVPESISRAVPEFIAARFRVAKEPEANDGDDEKDDADGFGDKVKGTGVVVGGAVSSTRRKVSAGFSED